MTAPYRSTVPAGRDGFGRLLLAEWTKLRSVPRWMLALPLATVLMVLVGLFTVSTSSIMVSGEDGTLGPGGRPVVDGFRFMHRPLTGDGAIVARVTAQTGSVPWAKAGIMIKERAEGGSPYAAMMVTPGHGVRFQSNFTDDVPGGAGPLPRWFRLTRSGDTVTGDESTDGRTWRRVGRARLRASPQGVRVGLFVTSPNERRHDRGLGGSAVGEFPSTGTATFDGVRVSGAQGTEPWRNEDVGRAAGPGGGTRSGEVFTLTGSGDIVPRVWSDERVRFPLVGAVVGLVVIIAVAVLFVTAEYRRDMIRTTFAVSPGRVRVLAAKAVVIGAAAFAAGLVAGLIAVPLSQPTLRANGFRPPLHPDPGLSDPAVLRAVVGTALLLAVVAVFALGAGAIVRRSAPAITAVIALLVLPTIVVAALPVSAGRWLMRVTPAAGFSIQRTTERFDHVDALCVPEDGCFFAEPWAGFGVLAAYAAVALLVAAWLLRRRDA